MKSNKMVLSELRIRNDVTQNFILIYYFYFDNTLHRFSKQHSFLENEIFDSDTTILIMYNSSSIIVSLLFS